jgi:antitoxin PrlF
MRSTLKAESKLTDRYQTTVPEPIRRVLKIGKRDSLSYVVRANGEVVLKRAVLVEKDDPAISSFLDFLAQDLAAHPDQINSLNSDLLKKISSLTRSVKFDLDEALQESDE